MILFDVSRNELFKLSDNLKTLQRKLKGNWRVASNREDSVVNQEVLGTCR